MLKTLFFFAGVLPLSTHAAQATIEIDYRQPTKPLSAFWNSTGFSPADIVATGEMKQVLRDIGQLPARGIKFVRPHYLLNLATVRGMETGRPVYDWTKLDGTLDELARNHLKLIFELMGFPSDGTGTSESQYDKNFQEQLVHQRSYFDDLRDHDHLARWKALITALALHLEERYGRDEVRSWLFETTNEPDLPHFWRYDVATFLNYYDACSEGLKGADASLQFGGPGTAHDLSETFVSLLDHCDAGKNYFTGETGVRIDFISIHDKAQPAPMIKRELQIFDFVRSHHPGFARKPFVNDEADPVVGWAKPYWWERGPWYAAFVAQNIDQHQRLVVEQAQINLRLLSNDHTFMGDWNQRTTHALFRDQPTGVGYVAIRKPVLTVMELIAQLGDHFVSVNVPPEFADHFGIIPTVDHDTLAILVYNKTTIEIGTESKPEPDVEVPLMEQQRVQVQLRIRGIKGQTAVLKEFRLDETHGNPHRTWLEMGKPAVLSDEQIAQLKKSESPVLVASEKIAFSDHEYSYQLFAPSPSVSLILIEPPSGPGK